MVWRKTGFSAMSVARTGSPDQVMWGRYASQEIHLFGGPRTKTEPGCYLGECLAWPSILHSMISLEDIQREVLEAQKRIGPFIRKTELLETTLLSGRQVYLKLENRQHTGAFKARGSLNKIMSLTDTELKAGVITASSGNHGLGVARSIQLTGVSGTIFLPTYAEESKVRSLAAYDVPLKFVDGTWLETEERARKEAVDRGATWISPYNDLKVIGGQGTVGLEIADQVQSVDRIFITVGGGGLLSGIGGYLKSRFPGVQIIACQPENSPEMYLSMQAGKVVTLATQKDTLSDGSAGALEATSVTFPVCQAIIDDFYLASEAEIASAMRRVYEKTGEVIEGSAGVAVAGYLQAEERPGTDVVVICGGNIDEDKFRELVG
jgi:threonine dehydratase